MSRKDRCADCKWCETEQWQKGRTALRCVRKGRWQGRVVDVCPTGFAKYGGHPVPAWCGGLERKTAEPDVGRI